jgi:transposase-like protein
MIRNLAGLSTRRVGGLVQTLGIERLSKWQVFVMAKSLGGMVDEFRHRPVDGGPYTYVWIQGAARPRRHSIAERAAPHRGSNSSVDTA